MQEVLELMKQRHSVRQYKDMAVDAKQRTVLNELVKEINRETGLHIQIFYDEPQCFDSFMAHYGKFSGVKNYVALVGKKSQNLVETSGYYGEKIVLIIQELGLNSCWVAMTHGKSKATVSQLLRACGGQIARWPLPDGRLCVRAFIRQKKRRFWNIDFRAAVFLCGCALPVKRRFLPCQSVKRAVCLLRGMLFSKFLLTFPTDCFIVRIIKCGFDFTFCCRRNGWQKELL